MKKITSILILFIVLFNTSAHADMDPKIKSLGTMALYGTVGGTLLGTASLAFGAKGRSVAIGASLGLYAGLLFGGYVVGTHAMKKRGYNQKKGGENYYPDTQGSPYEDPNGRMNESIFDGSIDDLAPLKKEKKQDQVYYVQLLQMSF